MRILPTLDNQDTDTTRGELAGVGLSSPARPVRKRNGLAKQEKPAEGLPKLRAKKCKSCRMSFTPSRPLQSVCSPQCAAAHAKTLRERTDKAEARIARLERKAEKEKAKSKGDWVREAQQVFNQFIRARDQGKPCISCGRHHQGQIHAGHYRATSVSPALRFNEENVHAQCQPCNCHKHGNLLEYRIGLIQRIGLDRVEWLEGKHEPKHYSIEDLKDIKQHYKNKLKGML